MEALTFQSLILSIINDVKSKHSIYTTITPVRGIIGLIENLSIAEQMKNSQIITKIKTTLKCIECYGTNNKPLTIRQMTILEDILEEAVTSCPKNPNHSIQSCPKNPNSSIQTCPKNLNSSIQSCSKNPNSSIQSCANINVKPKYFANVKKFDDNDIICEIVFGLLTNLNRNMMASSLTEYVMEYFEIISVILEGNKNKYQEIASDIQIMFKRHGWKSRSKTSLGGFHTAPNREKLSLDFNDIVNKYF